MDLLNDIPDVHLTNEHWILEKVKADKVYVKWLNPYSIKWNDANIEIDLSYFDTSQKTKMMMKCEGVTFEDDLDDKIHPWITPLCGNILSSPFSRNDVWKELDRLSLISSMKNSENLLLGQYFDIATLDNFGNH